MKCLLKYFALCIASNNWMYSVLFSCVALMYPLHVGCQLLSCLLRSAYSLIVLLVSPHQYDGEEIISYFLLFWDFIKISTYVPSVDVLSALHVYAVSRLFNLQIEEINHIPAPIHFSLINIPKIIKQKIQVILQKCVDSNFCMMERRHACYWILVLV